MRPDRLIFTLLNCRLRNADEAKQRIEAWLASEDSKVLIIETESPGGDTLPEVIIHGLSYEELKQLPKVVVRCVVEKMMGSYPGEMIGPPKLG